MKLRNRRLIAVAAALIGVVVWLVVNPESYDEVFVRDENSGADYAAVAAGGSGESGAADGSEGSGVADGSEGSEGSEGSDGDLGVPLATEVLERLEVKGRAPKTGYSRDAFYNGWPTVEGCSLRQKIIRREFGETAVMDGCNVLAGEYDEPYTGEHLVFSSRDEISKGVQIDHVVALSDAWQKGAQYMASEVRYEIATDPLNLLAVDASANGKKSDGDAATWLPPNKKFRCQYVARQVSVKYKYGLWVTEAEKEAISGVLTNCPRQRAVGVKL